METSGITQKEFCSWQGTKISTFDYWVNKKKQADSRPGIGLWRWMGESTSGDVFVFLNHKRTHLKLLHWEPGGFVCYYKRLEAGTFIPPKVEVNQPVVRWPQLVLMITGI